MGPFALTLAAALAWASVPRALALPGHMIGKVSGGFGGVHATGFLVGECEVLTVKHAAGWVKDPSRIRFTFAQGPSRPSTGARVIAHGGLDLVNGWWASDRRGDWMLLRLDRCLGAESGFAELSDTPFEQTPYFRLDAPPLINAGFPGEEGRRGKLTYIPACRIRVVAMMGHMNDCHARPGASGSPLFALTEDGGTTRVTVFAMQVAASLGSKPVSGGMLIDSVGLGTDQFLPAISDYLTGAKLQPIRRTGVNIANRRLDFELNEK